MCVRLFFKKKKNSSFFSLSLSLSAAAAVGSLRYRIVQEDCNVEKKEKIREGGWLPV